MFNFLFKNNCNEDSLFAPRRGIWDDIDGIQRRADEKILAKTQEDIPNTLYHETRDLFKNSIQQKKLSQVQILFIRDTIREMLGNKLKYYKGRKYKNEAHEVYSLLKSPFFNNNDFRSIIRTLDTFIQQ